MFEEIFNVFRDTIQALSDVLSGLFDLVVDGAYAFEQLLQRATNELIGSVENVGVPKSRRVELVCGGYVDIEYYIRNPV
jgi:hypothetical protein